MSTPNGVILQNVELEKTYLSGLCVSLINVEQFATAASEFKVFGDDSLLLSIVTSAYCRNINNLPKVIRFIKEIDNRRQQEIASEALLHLIKSSNNLRDHKVLYFSELNEEHMSPSLKNELKELKREIIKSVLYRYDPEMMYGALRVDENFTADEPTIKLEIYSQLLCQMEENGDLNRVELIMLAYKVRELDRHLKDNDHHHEQIRDKVNRLIDRFPAGVKALLWNKPFCIENKQHSGYRLTTSNSQVWTYPADNSIFQQWTAWPMEGGRYFQFEAKRTGINLYAEGQLYQRKLNVGYHKGPESLWQVIPSSNGHYFYLKNKEFGEVVDANELADSTSSSSGKCSRAYVHKMYLDNSYQLWSFY